MKIDIAEVVRSRMPGLYRFLPKKVVSGLERLIHQDELNELLIQNQDRVEGDFCKGVLDALNVEVRWKNPEKLPNKNCRRVIFASNHPLGGLDGMALIHLVQEHFGGNVRFIVNDLLMAIEPLQSCFLPISKFGKQSRESLQQIEQAFAGDDPILIFPAGLCSRLRKVQICGKAEKIVCDLDWKKMFVQKAIKHKRNIVPLHFDGENSLDFYRKANLRKRLRIPFNIEQLLLPREIFRSKGKCFEISIGNTIRWESIPENDATEYANMLRDASYRLKYGEESVINL